MTSFAQVRLCREWAARYLELNWNPLPKRSDDNRPALHRYSKLRDCGLGRAAIANWTAEGIQLATGGRWGLAVIDLDGPEASEVWRDWTVHRAMPRTWEVASGGGGRHLYFRVPAYAGLPTRNSTRALWLGSDRHSAIELIADRGLIVAPPSRHPKTGRPYEWTIGPDDSEHPADLPEWIASLARPRGRAAARPRGRRTTPPRVQPASWAVPWETIRGGVALLRLAGGR